MEIDAFRRILTAFADEPSDVDIRKARVVAQVRDEVIDVGLYRSQGEDQQLRIRENGQDYTARMWLIKRIARIPQLADRIITMTSTGPNDITKLPFIAPSGFISADLAKGEEIDSEVNNAVEVLSDQATNPAPGATSVLYLTSDAGEGKTTVINRVAHVQAKLYKEKKVSSLVVPIPLSGKSFLTFDDSVIAALVNKLRFNYLYFDAFIELVRMGVVVPAFDGYEEMLVEGSKGEAVSALGNLIQRLDSSGTLFVAARKAFFEYISFRTQARLLDAIGDRSAVFTRLALSRWSKPQFCEYGRLRKVNSPEDVYETVAVRLGDQHPLLTRAVLVRRLFDVLEGESEAELANLLGANPLDYFFTFVDTIVKREASEKWLARVSGDVMEPLLLQNEHHQLLSQIALEMWQLSTTSLRYEVLDVVVDIFCEGRKKRGAALRQIKERIKQHSLLSTDTSRGQGIGFDHEDFQNFYLGEGLGMILGKKRSTEIQAFFSANIVPTATIEQAVQYLIRHEAHLRDVMTTVMMINQSEANYSFCKENCGSLVIRLAEFVQDNQDVLHLSHMFFSAGVLAGRTLKQVHFDTCYFQPTHLSGSSFADVVFKDSEFERLEVDEQVALTGCTFVDCRIASLIFGAEEHIYEPALIAERLQKLDVMIGDARSVSQSRAPDDRIKLLERFFRAFLRQTHLDEEIIRLRLGNKFSSTFFDHVLPLLLSKGVLEEAPWRGKGIQRRFKLIRGMSEIEAALEESQGDFDKFLDEFRFQ